MHTQGAVLALLASIVGPFGGFLASAIKRAYAVKDFAGVIPGHGGCVCVCVVWSVCVCDQTGLCSKDFAGSSQATVGVCGRVCVCVCVQAYVVKAFA